MWEIYENSPYSTPYTELLYLLTTYFSANENFPEKRLGKTVTMQKIRKYAVEEL